MKEKLIAFVVVFAVFVSAAIITNSFIDMLRPSNPNKEALDGMKAMWAQHKLDTATIHTLEEQLEQCRGEALRGR